MAFVVNAHRPALEWLTDLKKAKVVGASGTRPKTTIQDLLEKVNDPNANEQSLFPTSPRSVEACFRLGIDPVELQYHPIVRYKYTGDTEEIAKVRYEKYETVRQERIKSLVEMRKKLVDDNWTGEPGRNTFPGQPLSEKKPKQSSAVLEKEKARFDAMKKRHEKEIQQVVQSETFRKELLDKQQRKQDALEVRIAELARQKAEQDRMWAEKQRELNLQRIREEAELEREARRLAEERYQREKEIQRRKEAEEREIKRKAMQTEMDRRQKTEAARQELERIQAEQEEQVRQRREHMEQLDAERQKRLTQEAKEKSIQNALRRKKAETRIQSAIRTNNDLLRRRREEFLRRERESEQRRAEFEEARRREEEARRLEEERKAQERVEKQLMVQEQEETRKRLLEERAAEKERLLIEQQAARRRETNLKRVDKEFEMKLRLDKADELQKVSLFQRQRLLESILDDYDRTRSLMRERQEIQERGKMASMEASMQRHQIMEAFENVRSKRDRMSATGGQHNVGGGHGLSRRPATAH